MGRWCLVVLLIGCGEPAGSGPDAFTPTFEPMTVTVRLTDIAREDSEGRMRGVDLDGRVSDATDELGCFQEDWTDSVGDEPGVDNNYYGLVVTSGALPRDPDAPSVDEMIREAEITLALGLASVAGGVEVRLAGAEPQVVPLSNGHFQALTEAVLVADFAELGLSHRIYDLAIDGVITEDGELTSLVVAGALDAAEIVATVESESPEVDPSLVRTTLEGVVDLDPGEDGLCTRMSAVFTAAVEP